MTTPNSTVKVLSNSLHVRFEPCRENCRGSMSRMMLWETFAGAPVPRRAVARGRYGRSVRSRCSVESGATHLPFSSPDVHSSTSFHSGSMGQPPAAPSNLSNATTVNGGSSPSGSLRRSLSNSGLGRARQRVTSLTVTLRNSIIMTDKDDA